MSDFHEERERYEYADHSWSPADWVSMQQFLKERADEVPQGATKRISVREGYNAQGQSTLWVCIKWRLIPGDPWQYTAGYNNSTMCPPWNC